MPVRPEAPGDLLSLYVNLASSRGAAMPARALREQFGSGIDRLLEIGAAHPGRPLPLVRCPACYQDHSAEITYDVASRRSWIFCPEAGRVLIEEDALATLHLNTTWLPDQLARALNVAPRPPRLTLVEHSAWLLGDIVVGSTQVSVALAVGIMGTGEVDQLIVGLGRRTVLDIGLVLAARCQLPEHVSLASKYAIVSLDELATFKDDAICVEPSRLGAWIIPRALMSDRCGPICAGRLR